MALYYPQRRHADYRATTTAQVCHVYWFSSFFDPGAIIARENDGVVKLLASDIDVYNQKTAMTE